MESNLKYIKLPGQHLTKISVRKYKIFSNVFVRETAVMALIAYCEGAKCFSMTFSVNVKTQLIEKRLNTCIVKLILYGDMKFENDSVILVQGLAPV